MTVRPIPEPDYFDANYRSYDGQNPPHKLAHYVANIEQSIPTDSPSVLDIGCGRGAFLKYSANHRPAWELYGSDINDRAVEDLRVELAGKATLEVASADRRPFGTREFDVITAFDVLEHLDEPAGTLASIRSWLKPGGVAVFVVPVYDGPTGPLIRRLDHDETHVQKHGRRFWVDLAESEFSDVSWHGIFRFLVTRNLYIHLASDRLRGMSPAILVSCRNSDR